MATQLWFDFVPSDGAYQEASFCSGPSNAVAMAALQRSNIWSSGALVLVGPKGSGKSHLAEIWRSKTSGKTLLGSSIPLHMTGNIVIENADQQVDEEGLFHLLNRAIDNKAKVLLVARTAPSAWPISLGDLISRLRAVELVRIDEPDDEVLICILQKLARDRSLRLDKKLLHYLVARMERSSQSALALVEQLNARSLEGLRPINRALAKQVLDGFDQTSDLVSLMIKNTDPSET